ncbi:hypothetical protein D3C86_1169500 [compost metagenome]
MADDQNTPEYMGGQQSALVIAIGLAIAWGSKKGREADEPNSPADRLEQIRTSARSALLQELPQSLTPRQIALTTAGFESTFANISRVVRGLTEFPDD